MQCGCWRLAFFSFSLLRCSLQQQTDISLKFFDTCKITSNVLHVCTVHQQYQNVFIIQTDAHYYKNHRTLKQFKNYNTWLRHVSVHAGTIIREQSCAQLKLQGMVLLCSSVQTQSMLWRHISLLCRRAVHRGGTAVCTVNCTPAQQADMFFVQQILLSA